MFDELPTEVWHFRRGDMTDLSGNLPNVSHALYCPKVLASGFEAHAKRGQTIWKNKYEFDPSAQTNRNLALPVWQLWNREGFQRVPPGTDMAQEAEWHPSLRPVLERGNVWISPGRSKMRRTDGSVENGFWFVFNLFKLDQTQAAWRLRDESEAERVKRHAGFRAAESLGILAAFISTDRMVEESYNGPQAPRRLHVRLYASRKPTAETLLNPETRPPEKPSHHEVIVQAWYGQRWSLEFMSTPLFEADSPRYRAWLVLFAGIGMTALASALVGVALRARSRQELMTEQIREARDALAAAQQEREKFSHDLHDGTIQSLYAIQLGLGHTVEKLEAEPVNARRELSAVRGELDAVIAEIRRFITPEARSDKPVDLCAVLRALVERARVSTDAKLGLHCIPEASQRLTGDQAVQFANIAREALSNSLRHAKAKQVEIELRSEQDAVALEIYDDGAGFDPKSPGQKGVGLTSMTMRAQELGGKLDIQSSSGKGTRIVLRVGVSPAERDKPEVMEEDEEEA